MRGSARAKGVIILSRGKLLAAVVVPLCVVAFFLFRGLRPSSGLSQEKFVQVYVELSVASSAFSADSSKLEEERARIFREAGVTQDAMDDFVDKLSRNPGEWPGAWKRIVEKLEQKRQELNSP